MNTWGKLGKIWATKQQSWNEVRTFTFKTSLKKHTWEPDLALACHSVTINRVVEESHWRIISSQVESNGETFAKVWSLIFKKKKTIVKKENNNFHIFKMNSVRFYFICMDHFTYNIKYKKLPWTIIPQSFIFSRLILNIKKAVQDFFMPRKFNYIISTWVVLDLAEI